MYSYLKQQQQQQQNNIKQTSCAYFGESGENIFWF